MDDLMKKMQEVLSDQESMQQLNELAAMFRSEMNGSPQQPAGDSPPPETDAAGQADSGAGFDFGKLLQLQGLFSSQQEDKNAALLLALRPHVSEERQQRIDRAVKLLRLYAMWSVLKESGLLQDLI